MLRCVYFVSYKAKQKGRMVLRLVKDSLTMSV